MEKIQNKNGFEFREINVYMQAEDCDNPLFQCWLTFVQEKGHVNLRSVSGKYYYDYGDENGNPTGFIHDMDSDYILEFFSNLFDRQLQRTGDILQGDCNSYAAAVVDFVIGAILGDGLMYDGNHTVMRVLK